MLVARRRERYRRAVERSVPDIASAIADAVSGGHSIRGALAAAPGSLDGPSSAELARVAADLELGTSTADALAAMRGRLRSERVDSLAAALLSQQVSGGDVAALMRRLAASAADRDRVADEARAATTQARFTGLLVVALPAGAALFAELLQPGFVSRVVSAARFGRDVDRGRLPAARRIRPDPPSRVPGRVTAVSVLAAAAIVLGLLAGC